MKIVINDLTYDSRDVPILIVFDNDKEQTIFGMKRFVSAPVESTVEERQKIIDTDI